MGEGAGGTCLLGLLKYTAWYLNMTSWFTRMQSWPLGVNYKNDQTVRERVTASYVIIVGWSHVTVGHIYSSVVRMC